MKSFTYQNSCVFIENTPFFYVDNTTNFTADLISLGILNLTFPENMVKRYYDQNVHIITYDDESEVNDVVPWDHGDDIIDAAEALQGLLDARRPERDLGATKNDVWQRVLALSEVKKLGGVLISGHWYSSKQDMNVVSKAALGSIVLDNTSYRDLDGNTVTLTEALAKSICSQISAREKACLDAAFVHKAQIDLLTTNQAVLNYDYTNGWPVSHGE
jgi:hypothetical protein